jgi:nitrogen fixation protein NifU and related proteins
MTRDEQIEFLLDHAQRRRNRTVLSHASFTRSGGNPGCGDLVTIYGQVEGDRLTRVTFQVEGCTLSQAGASIATELASGLTLAEADQLSYDRLFELMGRELAMARIRCATLGLDTLKEALRLYTIRRQLEGVPGQPVSA